MPALQMFGQRLEGPGRRGSLGHQRGGGKRASPQHFGLGLPGQCPRRWLPVRGAVPDTTFGCRPRIPIKQDGEVRPSGEGGSSYVSGVPRRGRMGCFECESGTPLKV